MAMPEAAPHVNQCSCARDNDVRTTRKAPVARPIPPTGGKDALPHQHFRRCVAAVDSAHEPTALFGRQAIHAHLTA